MDARLVGWARAVKSRRRRVAGAAPPLWLFTDAARGGDVIAAVAGLPKGLCGVVFRHDGEVGRVALARAVWRICNMRRLTMVIAGEQVGFCGPGAHLRGGRMTPKRGARAGFRTASAHGVAGLIQAGRSDAGLVFLSPAFQTASHPGQGWLGAVRWAGLARRCAIPVAALGGIDGRSAMRLPRWAAAAGAIGALLP